ncbi:GTP cyclohydrolase FolE2 [Celerinatantimonas sp. YJH-8]|uniref:GTP cyclohydrolase FolE2 n=1 Tax=Celerinatantimonas sp. YJH-8 TaxID=3228714 RepID=UPI0038BEECE5
MLPDVTSNQCAQQPSCLQWVGMEKIAVPFLVASQQGIFASVNGQVSVFVSLDKANAKGIHMSRLYLKLMERLANQSISLNRLQLILDELIESQQGISQSARLVLAFDLILKRSALISGEQGFAVYPVELTIEKKHMHYQLQVDLTIAYSSTCPCSASLSRELYKEAIEQQFSGTVIEKPQLLEWLVSEQGTVATPHSQRSYAYVSLTFKPETFPDFPQLIDMLEAAIETPVQTAVKRVDEQAFARLNAEHLMFCEDAARKVKRCLEQHDAVVGYQFKIEHQESLHGHNAVVMDRHFSSAFE